MVKNYTTNKGKVSDCKKGKAIRAMEKKRIRDKRNEKSLKRKRSGVDSDGDSDDDKCLTPAEQRARENGSNPLSSNHKKQKRDEKKSKERALREDHVAGGHKINDEDLPEPDFSELQPFERCFWTGAAGQDPPSDDLKEIRKAIGVNVRGLLDQCPPPVATVPSDHLPDCFSAIFAQLKLARPSPIQQQCWPAILAGANVLGLSPTGSGKTLAYGLPMVTHIQAAVKAAVPSRGDNLTPAFTIHTKKAAPIALVLVPTRELATQVTRVFKAFKRSFKLRAAAVYGGMNKEAQVEELTADGGAHIVVATPGRLLDLFATKQIILNAVTYLVIDEADRMLQMGFFEQLQAISRQVRPDRQALMFSATFPGRLRDISSDWIGEAVSIRCNTFDIGGAAVPPPAKEQEHKVKDTEQVTKSAGGTKEITKEITKEAPVLPKKTTAPVAATGDENSSRSHASLSSLSVSESVVQEVHVCATHKKPRLLIKFIQRRREAEKLEKLRQPGNMIIFCTKIKTLKFVHDFLLRQDTKGCVAIHGQMPQGMRERALADFKAGKCSILLATDVAARGLHIKKLQHVVNYDFPSNLEQYCHRVGRTGRQGEKGHAYSLITRNMAPMVGDLVSLLRKCSQETEPNLLALEAEFAAGGFEVTEDSEEEGGAEEG
jgi:superfamily II DNA/RNA helicase